MEKELLSERLRNIGKLMGTSASYQMLQSCAAEAEILEAQIEQLKEEVYPDPCNHLYTVSQGLERASYCGQCGEEL